MHRLKLLLVTIGMFGALDSAAEILRPSGVWPVFRGDLINSGRSSLVGQVDSELKPWSYQTGKGIFSTAVVDDQDNIYVGSADSYFYALSAQGEVNWRFKTGEIIDSAACLSTDGKQNFLTIPSGDGFIYQLRLPIAGNKDQPELLWKFDATADPHPKGKGYNWFEGNVTLGPDGQYYAGNTNGNFYALDANGKVRWTFLAKDMNWSAAAFDQDGALYIASLDFHFRKIRSSDGKVLWDQSSLGFNAGSLVLWNQQLIATSFDHKVYALDKTTGRILWRFQTQDHIYGSAAVSITKGQNRIYVTSTDGRLYALDASGRLLWSYDTGDVIRSSPIVNQSPEGTDVVYFGGGDGILYAIDEDGTLRWGFDTNSQDPFLRERNDLNASPAFTQKGVVIGGESGQIWFVPFDYPRLHPEDPRSLNDLPAKADGIHSLLLTPGARVVEQLAAGALSPSSLLTLRLQNIQDGQRVAGGLNTWFKTSSLTIEPNIPFTWQVSAKADTIFIKPQGFWQPDTDYRIQIKGQWMSGGLKLGAIEIGASTFTHFDTSLELKTAALQSNDLPWQVPDDRVTSFEIYRLAINQPSMIPSLNQIGFDSYHWLVSVVSKSAADSQGEGQLLAFVLGARPLTDGTVEPTVEQEFRFPMRGIFKGESFILRGEKIALNLGGIQVNMQDLEFRGQFGNDQVVSPLASFYARPAASSDLTYVPTLAALGLINNKLQMPLSGTFLTRSYQGKTADRKPQDLQILSLCSRPPTFWKEGLVEALVEGTPRPLDLFDFIAADPVSLRPVNLPEKPLIEALGHRQWRIKQKIPRASAWPQKPYLALMVNLYPLTTTSCSRQGF